MLDTNVFFIDSRCVKKLTDDGNEVVLPLVVIEELDKHKTDNTIGGYNVRQSLRWLEENDDKFSIITDSFEEEKNDNVIIKTALSTNSILISNDTAVLLKARKYGIPCERWKSIEQKELKQLRTGVHHIKDETDVYSIYNKTFKIKDNMYENDFILVYDDKDKIIDVLQIKNNEIIRPKIYDKTFNGSTPLDLEQKLALTHLFDKDLELITFSGGFGTSKSYIMLNSAIEMVDRGLYRKIYICKAPIPISKEVQTGFKPGEFLSGKMALPLGSVTSNLYNNNISKKGKFVEKIAGMSLLEQYVDLGIIEVLSVEDILGLSLAPNSILLIEEAQILSENVARAVFSRVGENSKVFVNGDLRQMSSNHLLPENNGLFKIINIFAGYPKSAHMTLFNVHRSNFVKELAKRWDL